MELRTHLFLDRLSIKYTNGSFLKHKSSKLQTTKSQFMQNFLKVLMLLMKKATISLHFSIGVLR